MNNDTKSIGGVTSLAYHTTMWILVIAGLLGNLMVFVWRCSRKESRHSLLSVLTSSLAFADLLFYCHFLLQEVMLANSVFGSNQENVTSNVTTLDKRLCLSTLFLLGVSANAIMLTAVAIALAIFFSFRLHRYGNRIVIGFLAISWMYCLAFGRVHLCESTYNSWRGQQLVFVLSSTLSLSSTTKHRSGSVSSRKRDRKHGGDYIIRERVQYVDKL